mmetsp:Transcript_27428/g.42834  ORF Transcript_27428/g.42834 Transcript_27428/m.42834 type:complete len:105 (-) Transcript_27428:595-909(-)
MEDVDYNRMERDEGASANFLHLDGCNFVSMARKSAVGLTVLMFIGPLLPMNGLILLHFPIFVLNMVNPNQQSLKLVQAPPFCKCPPSWVDPNHKPKLVSWFSGR